jgi:outer membrane lipoprotein carrier protein
MRWDYKTPEDDKKIIVADGKTLWMYQPDDNQVFKQPLTSSSLPAQVSFLVGEGKLADEFDASDAKLDGVPDGNVAIKLVPKTGTSAYRYVVFVVDAKSGQVVRTVIYDTVGGTNTLSFSDVQQNKGCADDKFKFAPPAGTKVIKAPGAQP